MQNISPSYSDIRLRRSDSYTINDTTYSRIQNAPLPVFSGAQSIGVVGCPLWSPVGAGNGFLFETGYAKDRVGQIFIDTGGNLYTRFANETNRNTTQGWKKY